MQYSSTQTWHLFLIIRDCSQILIKFLINACVLFVCSSCGVTNLTLSDGIWLLQKSPYESLSSAEEIQVQDSIVKHMVSS